MFHQFLGGAEAMELIDPELAGYLRRSVFTDHGRRGPRAYTLNDLTVLMVRLPADRLVGHLRRNDLSKWIAGVFRDPELANDVQTAGRRVDADDARRIADAIVQAIRARYDARPSMRTPAANGSVG